MATIWTGNIPRNKTYLETLSDIMGPAQQQELEFTKKMNEDPAFRKNIMDMQELRKQFVEGVPTSRMVPNPDYANGPEVTGPPDVVGEIEKYNDWGAESTNDTRRPDPNFIAGQRIAQPGVSPFREEMTTEHLPWNVLAARQAARYKEESTPLVDRTLAANEAAAKTDYYGSNAAEARAKAMYYGQQADQLPIENQIKLADLGFKGDQLKAETNRHNYKTQVDAMVDLQKLQATLSAMNQKGQLSADTLWRASESTLNEINARESNFVKERTDATKVTMPSERLEATRRGYDLTKNRLQEITFAIQTANQAVQSENPGIRAQALTSLNTFKGLAQKYVGDVEHRSKELATTILTRGQANPVQKVKQVMELGQDLATTFKEPRLAEKFIVDVLGKDSQKHGWTSLLGGGKTYLDIYKGLVGAEAGNGE